MGALLELAGPRSSSLRAPRIAHRGWLPAMPLLAPVQIPDPPRRLVWHESCVESTRNEVADGWRSEPSSPRLHAIQAGQSARRTFDGRILERGSPRLLAPS